MSKLEKGVGFKNGIKDFFSQVSGTTIMSGVISAIFSFSAGLIYIASAQEAGMDPETIKSWVTAVYGISGIFAILVPIYFRKPINFANSIPAATVFTAMAVNFTMEELMAGGVISGIILVVLGLSGQIKNIMERIPVPIIMGMIAGVFLRFGMNIVSPIAAAPLVVLLMIAAYFIASKWFKRLPGVIASLIVGIVYLIITGIDVPAFELAFRLPTFMIPDFFSGRLFSVIIAYTLPLTILVVGAENAQAYGVLVTEEYDPPINSMTFWSGIGGIVSSFFVLHNTNVAGPMTAICASPENGPYEGRWTGSVVQGLTVWLGSFFFASFATFFTSLPPYIMNVVVGLAILKVLMSSFSGAFSDSETMFGATIAFLVGASGLTLLSITAPFWALVGGFMVYFFFEKKPDLATLEEK